jgi:hypothetical protein
MGEMFAFPISIYPFIFYHISQKVIIVLSISYI